jgi:catechol 2,3-dioxygenase-like lactoylglutathione lyase family enzyme
MNLNQITVPVTSLSASITFYESLGLKLIVRSDPEYARFICSAGDSTFSLHRVNVSTSGENGVWIYFEVEDVDKTVTDLEAKGVKIEEIPEDKRWLWREARIKDPDGNVVIVYRAAEMRKDPPWRLEESK